MTADDTIRRIDAALAALPGDKTISDAEANRRHASLQVERKYAFELRRREREEASRYAPTRFIGKCKACNKAATSVIVTMSRGSKPTFTAETGEVLRPVDIGGYSPLWYHCRLCGGNIKVHAVRGEYKADEECGAKCQAAKGPDCECSCAGLNHGKAWGG